MLLYTREYVHPVPSAVHHSDPSHPDEISFNGSPSEPVLIFFWKNIIRDP